MEDRRIFNTTDSSLVQFNGAVLTVLGPCDEKTYDKFDVGPMFNCLFPDGEIREVFEDEIFEIAT